MKKLLEFASVFLLTIIYLFTPFPFEFFILTPLILVMLTKITKDMLAKRKLRTILLLVFEYLIILVIGLIRLDVYNSVFGIASMVIIVVMPLVLIILPLTFAKRKYNKDVGMKDEELNTNENYDRNSIDMKLRVINNVIWLVFFIGSIIGLVLVLL